MPPTQLRERLQELAQQDIIYNRITLREDQSLPEEETDDDDSLSQSLRYVDANVNTSKTLSNDGPQHEQLESHDRIPGVYEGGGTVWECSVDLVRYLHAKMSSDYRKTTATGNVTEKFLDLRMILSLPTTGSSHVRILELGCGHALPACFLLRTVLQYQQRLADQDTRAASSRTLPRYSFVLVDYNDYVLHGTTVPNIVLNTGDWLDNITNLVDDNQDIVNEPEMNAQRQSLCTVTLGHGDWNSMSTLLLQHSSSDTGKDTMPCDTFDIILAAETIYSGTAAVDTAELLFRHLADDGVAFVATKRYYFGVGGGTESFCEAIHRCNQQHSTESIAAAETTPQQSQGPLPLVTETVQVLDNGRGNIREILKVNRQSRCLS